MPVRPCDELARKAEPTLIATLAAPRKRCGQGLISSRTGRRVQLGQVITKVSSGFSDLRGRSGQCDAIRIGREQMSERSATHLRGQQLVVLAEEPARDRDLLSEHPDVVR